MFSQGCHEWMDTQPLFLTESPYVALAGLELYQGSLELVAASSPAARITDMYCHISQWPALDSGTSSTLLLGLIKHIFCCFEIELYFSRAWSFSP